MSEPHDQTRSALPLPRLPAPTGAFVGRAEEIARLEAALRGADGPVAAIGAAVGGVRGMGGVGKTELALLVASRLADRYPAQYLLDLQGSRPGAPLGPASALQQVIRAFRPDLLQLPEDARELAGIYRAALAERGPALVLADDAHDAVQIDALAPPPGCALLVTSRRRFALRRGAMLTIDLERLSADEGLELLARLCPRIPAPQAATIVRLCGGLPLALVVSAGLLESDQTIEIEQYVQQLTDERTRLAKLRDLEGPTLDVEASLELSYRALEPPAQAALAQLGVFAAPFDQAAALALLELPADADPAAALSLLHRRSLLDYAPAERRYQLHELVRVFALARLAGDEPAARLRHACYFIAVAEQADQQYLGGGAGVLAGLALFDRERPHLDAARAWLQAQPPNPGLDALLIADADATAHTGDLRYAMRDERIPQLQRALAAAQRQHDREAQGRLLGNLGLAYAALGEARKAIGFYEQWLTIACETGNRRNEGNALGNLGIAYAALGEARKAIGFYEQWLTIARETGDRRNEGSALGNLGNAYFTLSEARKVIGFYEQQLTIARETGDRRSEGNALGNLGNAYATLGEDQPAIVYYRQALTVKGAIEDALGTAETQSNLGLLLARQGDMAGALAQLEQSLAFHQAIDHPRAAAMADLIAHLRAHGSLPAQPAQAPAPAPDELLALLPETVRAAVEQQDTQALQDALAALPPDEQAQAVQTLQTLQQQAAARLLALDPDALLAALPDSLRAAVEQQDQHALQAALAALPPDEQAQAVQTLTLLMTRAELLRQRAEARPRPDIDEVVRGFLPLLGDIALAAHGDPSARALAEAYLPGLEERGWHLTDAAQRIWAGARDAAALTQGLDAQDSALVRRALALVADGPSMIFVAESLQIAHARRQADAAFAQAQPVSAEQRAELARQLAEAAEQAAQQPGAPWAKLAAHLRGLAERLTVNG